MTLLQVMWKFNNKGFIFRELWRFAFKQNGTVTLLLSDQYWKESENNKLATLCTWEQPAENSIEILRWKYFENQCRLHGNAQKVKTILVSLTAGVFQVV